MIFNSRTGKVLVTQKQLIKDIKKHFSGLTDKELRKKMEEQMKKNKKLIQGEIRR